MTAPYLLSLAALHAAAPGVLDVVFGPDGDFEGAPKWRPMLRGSLKGAPGYYPLWHLGARGPVALHRDAYGFATSIDDAGLDLRIPSVAARLMRLCSFVETVDADLSPEALATLTLAWAPRIAALRTT